MTALSLLALAAAAMLAFANGANDNAKGVATLIGGGTLSHKAAIRFAAIATLLGSIGAVFIAGLLLRTFGGKGIVSDSIAASAAFPCSVGLAAAVTVLLATRFGFPISTTHALAGAIIGVGLSAAAVNWSGVWSKVFLPLLISPPLAVLLAAIAYRLFSWLRRRSGITCQTCVCVEREFVPVSVTADGAMQVAATGTHVEVDDTTRCAERLEGRIAGIDAQRALDVSHFISAGALSFARGLNDTPKIAAVMLAAGAASLSEPGAAFFAVGVAIALGGILAVRRVAKTMSCRITDMNDGQAFTANLITAGLVIFASRLGVPVSTTHVSCGSLFGIGAASRRAHWPVIGSILIAWVTTLPVASAIGWILFRALS